MAEAEGRPHREAKATEKGLLWQIEIKSKEFESLIKTWRRTANKLRVLLGDESATSTIQETRDCLQTNVDKLILTQDELMALRATAKIDDDSVGKLDEVEEEHSNLMKQTLEVLIAQREGTASSRTSTKRSKKSHAVRVVSEKQQDCQDWVNGIRDVEPETHPNVNDLQGDAVKVLIEQMRMTRLPLPEPVTFAGDPMSFPAWKHAFDVLIQQSGIQPMDRFFYLQKYLRSQPLELVRGYALVGNDKAYGEAMTALTSRYGDPFIIANAFRDKLERWPKISPKDAIGLRNLSDFLHQCVSAMDKIGNLHHLNDERENQKILYKLPDWLVARWSRKVIDWRDVNGQFPPFQIFAKFIEAEAKVACYPVTSLHGKIDGPSNKTKSTSDVRTLSTNVTYPNSGSREREKRVKPQSCSCCKKDHSLQECTEFASKNMADRKSHIREKGLCYGCLKYGHMSKAYRRRSTCDICKGRHPSLLHENRNRPEPKKELEVDPRPNETQSSWSHASFSQHSDAGLTITKSTMIVPVWLSHSTTSDERMIYALLDTQSDTTFLLEKTKNEMNLHGTPVSLLLSTMSAMDERVPSERIEGLSIRSFDGEQRIALPSTYTRQFIPANHDHIPTPEMATSIPHLSKISHNLLPLQDCEIGLLIGYDCARALIPRDVIPPDHDRPNGPYGQKTDLGWSIVGTVKEIEHNFEDDPVGVSHRLTACEIPAELKTGNKDVLFAHHTSVKEEITPARVTRLMEADFLDTKAEGVAYSQNDVKFMNIMRDEIHKLDDGHYEMPLPFKDEKPKLPNNRVLAKGRLDHLGRKFKQNDEYRKKYTKVMETLLEKGYAEPAPDHKTDGKVWYIPHHGVVQPNKLRVVFDCSAKYKGESLNSHLLTGPDLTNKLVGVLCRFRLDHIAFMCDIQEMFHQFRVNLEDRDYLRFLWWKDGNYDEVPNEFRMKVHLFGAASSRGCANFGLRQTASDHAAEFGEDVRDFIHQEFYVDDGLKSLPTVHQAVDLISRTKKLCEKGGLHLHKLVSNSREVLQTVPEEDRAKTVRDLLHDDLPLERALGVQWCVESDSFNFRITLQDKPLTRRGILSTVMSIYDPLGLLAPIVLTGKKILQALCKLSTDWDDPLPDDLRVKWENWRKDILQLESISIPRCYKPTNFKSIKSIQFHYFTDASTSGYGQCTYMRLTDVTDKVHCTLVIGKSRVAPLKSVTVPRLELTAAVVAAKVKKFLEAELKFDDAEHVFWTDSRVVLGYINNTDKRFHVFVANRIQQIRDFSRPPEWKYIGSKNNPADEASRGLTVNQLNDSKWLHGPKMLWEQTIPTYEVKETFDVLPNDPEVKRSQVHVSQSREDGFDLHRLQRFSSWLVARKAVAYWLIFISRLKQRCRERHAKKAKDDPLTKANVAVLDLHQAEIEILKHVQREAFGDEIQILKSIQNDQGLTERKKKRQIKKASRLHGLDAFLDKDDILRVGGRIRRGDDSYIRKHPAILPQSHHITEIIIRHCNALTAHQGRGMTLNQIRENGFWVLGGSNRVSKLIRKCVICQKLRSPTQIQKMSDLPSDRVTEAPPFTYCGMDCFGPWMIKEGRKDLKRYGLIFTCMASRAVHIETLNSLTTDSFIQAFRRFTALRGPVQQLRCDRGTNFVGAEAELKRAWHEMDHQKVKDCLLSDGCDYVHFIFNVPSASHMGGVWERQIRSIRSVLDTLLYQSGRQLDDESLRTLMCEAAAIINSRPLTVTHLNDPTYPAPLTPNHLITMKSKAWTWLRRIIYCYWGCCDNAQHPQ
ncbi:uncharacterized protein LOC135156433 [Lytechinus pictus]|uniref:uncharacterized protein LOC135156433 n=1 Tax=Lytechinus pictus TaxID=7653 RepID=UPI0030BA1329